MLETVLSLLNELLAESLETPLCEEDICTPLSEYGFDSLVFVQFIVCLEDKLMIEIYDSDLLIENFATVDQILKTLDKYELS